MGRNCSAHDGAEVTSQPVQERGGVWLQVVNALQGNQVTRPVNVGETVSVLARPQVAGPQFGALYFFFGCVGSLFLHAGFP